MLVRINYLPIEFLLQTARLSECDVPYSQNHMLPVLEGPTNQTITMGRPPPSPATETYHLTYYIQYKLHISYPQTTTHSSQNNLFQKQCKE